MIKTLDLISAFDIPMGDVKMPINTGINHSNAYISGMDTKSASANMHALAEAIKELAKKPKNLIIFKPKNMGKSWPIDRMIALSCPRPHRIDPDARYYYHQPKVRTASTRININHHNEGLKLRTQQSSEDKSKPGASFLLLNLTSRITED